MMDLAISFVSASWSVFGAMAPYLLLGFIVAGFLSVLISPEWVERHLGGNGFTQVFKASIFGIPLPLCSCGVIPVAASLRYHGASKGATTAFLLSTPQTGVDSVAVTYALLGPFLAVVRPLAAFVTGIFGGGLVQVFNHENGASSSEILEGDQTSCCSSGDCDQGLVGRPKFFEALHYGLVTLPRDIGKALIFGVVISGLIAAFVAPRALESYLGGGLLPMLAAMAIGIPLYVCATASTPIALGLIHAGLSPGAALVFLISGPATNMAALTTLWKVLGRRAAVVYLLTVAVASLATGVAVDGLIDVGGLPKSALVPVTAAIQDSAEHVHHDGAKGIGSVFETTCAVFLVLVLANALRPRKRKTEVKTSEDLSQQVLQMRVGGMSCNGCVQSLQRALGEVPGVTSAEVSLEEGSATVRGREFAEKALIEVVVSLGFKVEG